MSYKENCVNVPCMSQGQSPHPRGDPPVGARSLRCGAQRPRRLSGRGSQGLGQTDFAGPEEKVAEAEALSFCLADFQA
jgi:hypothetical protein